MLQYNKLYQSLKKVHGEWHAGHVEWGYSWNYLKFYEDGTVIYCSTGDRHDLINQWFNKENSGTPFSRGQFVINQNNTIELTIKTMLGSITMDGNILQTKLILRKTNHEVKRGESWDLYSMV